MNYFPPKALDSAALEAQADKFTAWLNGSSDDLKCLIEDMSIEELKTKADEARKKLSEPGVSAAERQRIVFACALFRDASFSFARRGQLLTAAASGRFGEILEASTFSKIHLEKR